MGHPEARGLLGYGPSGLLEPVAGEVRSISIIMDEGQDTGPDNFGLVVLDNITVNNRVAGHGPTDADKTARRLPSGPCS